MARKNWRVKASKAGAKPDKPRPFTAASGRRCAIQAEDAEQKKQATFEGNAYTGAVMRPSGWWSRLVVDLEGVRVPSEQRPVLRQHDHEQIVGHTTAVKVEKDGIKVAGVFSGEPQHTTKVTVPAKNGFAWQLSIGADPVRTEFLEDGEETEVNGETVTGPLTISRETELGEISFVPLGADGNTSATVSASRERRQMKKNFQAAFKAFKATGSVAAGKYNDDEIEKMSEDDAKAALKKCMAEDETESESADDADDSETDTDPKKSESSTKQTIRAELDKELKAARTEIVAEMRRQNEIVARVQKYTQNGTALKIEVEGKKVDLVPHAIEAGWTPDQAELHALRQHRPAAGVGGPHFHIPTDPEVTDAVLECAVFDALPQFKLFDTDFYKNGDNGKRRIPEREEKRVTAELGARYTDQVRQAAHTKFKSRIGLQQLLTTLAAANGYKGKPTFNDLSGWEEVAAFLKQPSIRADGASTVNTPATLANVQNKFMIQGYYFTELAYLEFCNVLPVKDLKPTKSVQLFGDFVFKQLNPGGEIQHATIGDNPYANQAQIQARMVTLELQYLINDDLGMFGQVPMMLGRGWGLRLNDLVYTKLLSPGTDDGGSTNFFALTHTITGQSANANYQSGAGSTLTHDGLKAAKILLDRQVDPAGKKLGVDAEILLYPPELDVAAIELMNAQFIVMAGLASTSAATKQANTNIWKGRFKPVMSRYLSDSNYTGYSLTGWYLLVNPAIYPVIQIAALNGQMTPTVQTASQDWQFNMLGISTRGWGGVGVSMQNFRGGVLSAGA